MSLFKFKRFIACFVDNNGDYVGKQVFHRSMGALGHDKKTFNYQDGSYNIVPSLSSRLELIFGTGILWDNYIYVYKLGNPDPISFKDGGFKPIMNADLYKVRLESKLVKDLNAAARGTFQINWKYVLIALVVLFIIFYFLNGGSLDFGGTQAVAETATNTGGAR